MNLLPPLHLHLNYVHVHLRLNLLFIVASISIFISIHLPLHLDLMFNATLFQALRSWGNKGRSFPRLIPLVFPFDRPLFSLDRRQLPRAWNLLVEYRHNCLIPWLHVMWHSNVIELRWSELTNQIPHNGMETSNQSTITLSFTQLSPLQKQSRKTSCL